MVKQIKPSIYFGGLVGESKFTVLALTGKKSSQYLAPYVTIFNKTHKFYNIHLVEALNKTQMLNLTFPVIAKPGIGCRGAGIKIIRDEAEAEIFYIHTRINNRDNYSP